MKFAPGIREPLNKSSISRDVQQAGQNSPSKQEAAGGIFTDSFPWTLQKGAPLYQAGGRFLPALASAYKLAQANMAYKRFSFFLSPRYTVFVYPNGQEENRRRSLSDTRRLRRRVGYDDRQADHLPQKLLFSFYTSPSILSSR